jgi:hypothetical protein
VFPQDAMKERGDRYMKAVQCSALLKYLPLAVGKLIPLKNKHWKFLLHLSHMVDLIFALCFTDRMVVYMKHVISDHLAMFVKLYSTEDIRLRPKHHFLVHPPSIVLKSGPLTGMSCMRYELKNSFFKRCAHIVCNFRNICYTLAYRHQQQALYSQLSNSHIRNVVVVGKHSFASIESLPYCTALCDRLNVKKDEEIALSNKLNVASVCYKVGHIVVLGIDTLTGCPEFGKIVIFVCCEKDDQSNQEKDKKDEWHFVVEKVKTDNWTLHLHSYEVLFVQPPEFGVFRQIELAAYHPLYCYSLLAGAEK